MPKKKAEQKQKKQEAPATTEELGAEELLESNESGEESSKKPLLYVGIGASAGGLEAIEAFFSEMPEDTGMAFIVVQHLSPDYKSLMVELLSKRTPMAVKRSEEGMLVERNTVYLIPPKTELTIFHGKLLLREHATTNSPHLPIDLFFKSLADDQGEQAVGIVLSGTGSDGMRGVRQIKGNGGVVLVQSPSTAKFDGMPKSAIATGLADFTLAPNEMPSQLQLLLQQPNLALLKKSQPSVEQTDLDKLFALVRDQHGVDFTHYKSSTVLRRIERRMTMNQCGTLVSYVSLLQAQPSELTQLFKELLIGVTNFFRDPEAFALLDNKFLPDYLKRFKESEMRIWIAGCSSGEEAYSIAILICEALERMGRKLTVKIFATDVDPDALLRAGAGVFPISALADVPKQLQNKYFHMRDQEVQISRKIREMVVFAQHNIVKDPPFTNIDLVSCRNLLIYLQPSLQRKALEYFNFSLRESGLLFLGSSETTGDMNEFFELLDAKWKIYRSRGKRHPLGLAANTVASAGSPVRLERNWDKAGPSRRTIEEDRVLTRLLTGLSQSILPVVVVVSESYEMLHATGELSNYFKLQQGRLTNDVTKMAVKELTIPLSTGLQRAFSSKEDLTYTNIRIENNGDVEVVNLKLILLPGKRGQEQLVAVVIEPRIELPETPKESNGNQSYDVGLDAERRIADLEGELQFSKENLQATIEELETSNEELQATNEELLASNEELQSTNEELQSVNEELHTVNSEHQLRIFELTELNNDLDNLLTSSDLATLFLDDALTVRKFTPAFAELLNLMDSDIGRPIASLPHRLQNVDLQEIADEVQKTQKEIEIEVSSPGGRLFLLRALPYHIGPKIFSGIIITLIDITSIKTSEQAVERREGQLSDLAAIARIAWWIYDPEDESFDWQPEAITMLGLDKLSTVNDPTRDVTLDQLSGVFDPESSDNFRTAFNQCLFKKVPMDVIVSSGRKTLRIIGQQRQFAPGGKARLQGVVQDISQHTILKEALGEKQSEYRELFQNLASGVCVLTHNKESGGFMIDNLNQSGQSILQLGDLKGGVQATVELTKCLPGAESCGLLKALKQVESTGRSLQFPVYHYVDEARDIWLECSIYKLPSGNTVLIFDDVSERIEREEAEGKNKPA